VSQGSLWTCPDCGRAFANRNQTHTCAVLGDLERHFAGKPAVIRATFDALVARLEAIGPVRVLPQKSRIAFQVRMSFAQVQPKQVWIDGHLVLAERHEVPLFRRLVTYSPRNHTHEFRLATPADLTPEFDHYLRLAYAVGAQQHLARS
jgi:hypothetical protein